MAELTIIGTGNMARAIGTRAAAAGRQVRILGRTEEAATALASDIGGGASAGTVDAGLAGEGAARIVVLAVWYPAATELLRQHAPALAGTTVVDITNPVDTATFDGLVTPPGSSAAEQLALLAPEAAVVKAFNTTFAGTLIAGEVSGQPLDVLVAADDDAAKQAVLDLANEAGLRGVDAGPLRRARELEALGFLHMTLQQSLGTGYASTVKFLG
jgi:8-hydroxy-5-deazaflavin:NADPH oxidoreductase